MQLFPWKQPIAERESAATPINSDSKRNQRIDQYLNFSVYHSFIYFRDEFVIWFYDKI